MGVKASGLQQTCYLIDIASVVATDQYGDEKLDLIRILKKKLG